MIENTGGSAWRKSKQAGVDFAGLNFWKVLWNLYCFYQDNRVIK